MKQSSPLVSALILNFRSPKDTLKCVAALQAQTIADRIEIIVGDNGSEDESMGMFRALWGRGNERLRIIETGRNRGYGQGNNYLASYARGKYVLIINPDNAIPPDGLERMVKLLDDHADIGIVGPALVYPDGTVRPSARNFPTIFDLLWKRLRPVDWQRHYEQKLQEATRYQLPATSYVAVDWLVGACLLLKTDLYRQLEGFDPRFFLFFEDIDLCRRTKLLGLTVAYMDSVHVLDRKMRLSGNSLLSLLRRKTTWIHVASGLKYFWKWGVTSS